MKDMEKTYFLGTPREMRSDKKTTHGFLEVMKESAIDGYQEIFFMPSIRESSSRLRTQLARVSQKYGLLHSFMLKALVKALVTSRQRATSSRKYWPVRKVCVLTTR